MRGRSSESLGESWRSSENLGETRRVLEKLGESWRNSESLGEAQRILEKLGKAWKSSENLGEAQRSVGTPFSPDDDSIISHIKSLFAVLLFRVCYNERYRNKCREGLCYCL